MDLRDVHWASYESERSERWSMAETGEDEAAKKICKIVAKTLSLSVVDIEYTRYDKLWFDKYDTKNPLNAWVKGVPDYSFCIKIKPAKYLYIEIKLKTTEFLKTVTGGRTKSGSEITKYGCTSYYLDVKPVYYNMIKFVENAKMPQEKFLIAFTKDDDFRFITLNEVTNMIKNGWDGHPICQYGEGYGQKTYLIPKDATYYLSSEIITSASLPNFIKP